ncbi:hypothetical protein ONO86_03626 [Micromonospora noduli]|nr:hypothetical protein ONO86_03626 [Micromonospora noduli]
MRTNAARSLICMAEQSAMLSPAIRDDSAAALSRVPPQSSQLVKVTARSTKARMCGCIDSRSLDRRSRLTLTARPSYVQLLLPTLILVAGLCRKSSHCCGVKSWSLTSGSNRPEPTMVCQYQESTAKLGTVMAPSLRERSTSTSSLTSRSETRPSPSQVGHMPSGRLKLNAPAPPTDGWPSRLKRIRSMAYASVAVPTVERELTPIRSWSTTMAALRLRSESTSGRLRFGMNDWRNAL